MKNYEINVEIQAKDKKEIPDYLNFLFTIEAENIYEAYHTLINILDLDD